MLAQILAEKFRRTKYENVLQWRLTCKVPLSNETVSKILLRGIEPSVTTFIIMAHYLQVPTEEIAAACKAAGDEVFCELLAPTTLDPQDLAVVKKINRLNDRSKKAVLDMIEAFSACEV